MKAEVGALIALLGLLAVLTAGCMISSGGETGGVGHINWLYDWQEATSKAQAENKPIMVNFYTDACPWCARLDRDTFANGSVAAFLNKDFVNVKINTRGSQVAGYYGIRQVPTNLFAAPDGREIGRKVGYLPPDRYTNLAKKMLGDWEKLAE